MRPSLHDQNEHRLVISYLCFTEVDISIFFFFNDTATTEIYTLSLHDALPIADAELWVAGTGSEDARLRRLAEELAPGSVRFVGRVEPGGMPALYDACDVFVNASVIDNQPLSVLEAFAAGLPVVSTPTGDIASMVKNGETGLLVGPEDPAALADAVESLLGDHTRARALAR